MFTHFGGWHCVGGKSMSLRHVQLAAAQAVNAVWSGKNLSEWIGAYRHQVRNWRESERSAWLDMVYGCQRYGGTLQFYLRQMVRNPLSDLLSEALLVVALYQLAYTKNAPHAVVHEAVQACGKVAKGKFKSLTNAVLRRFLRERETLAFQAAKNNVAQYNFPQWWIDRMSSDFSSDWQDILAVAQNHPPMTLRINRRHCDALHYLRLLQDVGLDGILLGSQSIRLHCPVAVEKLPYFAEGWVSVQDFGAQQAASFLSVKDGERVLDACAAPGGKTGHILENADCTLLALDVDKKRLARVADNLQRLRLQAALICADARQTKDWYDGVPFDAILADIPCTASGVVRRHPDIKWLRRPEDAANTALQQLPMLDALWGCLKTGGRMLLSTCSVFNEENQLQTQAFLQRNPNSVLREEKHILPAENTDGFYYALFYKK